MYVEVINLTDHCYILDFFQDVLNGPPTAQDTLWNVAKEKHTPKGIDC